MKSSKSLDSPKSFTYGEAFTVLDSAAKIATHKWSGTPKGVPVHALQSIVLSNAVASADPRAPWTCTARIGDDVRTARIVRITASNDDLREIAQRLRQRYDEVFDVDKKDADLCARPVVCALRPRLTLRDLGSIRIVRARHRGVIAQHADGASLEMPDKMSAAAQCDALMRFAASRVAERRLKRGAAWLDAYREYVRLRDASALVPGGVLAFYRKLPPELDRASRKAKSWVRANRTQIFERMAAMSGSLGPFASRDERLAQAIAAILPGGEVETDRRVYADLAGFLPYGSGAR